MAMPTDIFIRNRSSESIWVSVNSWDDAPYEYYKIESGKGINWSRGDYRGFVMAHAHENNPSINTHNFTAYYVMCGGDDEYTYKDGKFTFKKKVLEPLKKL